MQKYVNQLLGDLRAAKPALVFHDLPFSREDEEGEEWLESIEELDLAPRKPLSEWVGIRKIQLPPAHMLSEAQIHSLLREIIDLLYAFNIMVAFHTYVPESKQYQVIRRQWDQKVPFLSHTVYYLEYCEQDLRNCPLGSEHCQCAFLEEYLFAAFNPDHDREEADDYLHDKSDPPYRRGFWDELDF